MFEKGIMTAMSGKPPTVEEPILMVPLIEMKTGGRSEGGKLAIAHQKKFTFGPLRDLAHDLLKRSADADKEKGPDDYSDLVAVVLLLVASLEAFVNDMLITQARRDYGKDYKQVAEGLLGGSFRSRLLRIIPVASRGQKCLDLGHHKMGLVLKLIKTRNQLAHSKEYYVENPTGEGTEEGTPGESLTLEECVNYADAVDSYFAAVLSGTMVLEGRSPWEHELVADAEPERGKASNGEKDPER